MFHKRRQIKDILDNGRPDEEMTVMGWVRTFRNDQFVALNDGSTNTNLQIVIKPEISDKNVSKRLTTSAAIKVFGKLAESPGKGQRVELIADQIEILGDSDPNKYPLQPKRHSLEFLREIQHLRFRTNTFASVFRVRSTIAFAIHKYFNDRNFVYLHTPIITASDAEGAGETFHVTNFDLNNIPKTEDGKIDFAADFFGRSANLTVSGQLEAELGATSLGNVYTFGPTFRAENSNTTRHLAEFWMIEPEMAFYDLEDDMDLAEDFIKFLIRYTLEQCPEDLAFLNKRLEDEEKQKPQKDRSEMGLLEKLEFILEHDFERVSYTEAIDILKNSKQNKKKKFKYLIEEWGIDLQSEHERYLVEKHFKKPVILYDYPKDIKAFYMRQNDDGITVAAMDVLAPGIGEIIGGSQREERLDFLEKRMQEMNIPAEDLYWYLDIRRYGTIPHAGFGLGFERMVQFITGMTNIRDVIPFPRYPKHLDY